MFDRPLMLLLLAAGVPALLGGGSRWLACPSLLAVPRDGGSRVVDWLLRGLAAGTVFAIVLGLAGLHSGGQRVERIGHGAHVAVVLDRSLSMDEGFALQGEKARETKTQAAVRMIAGLFAGRPHDSFALVAFSTAPIPAMPMTEHRAAFSAAVAAMDRPGLANTDIGAGLAMGLMQFRAADRTDDADAARVLLLVSDGAGAIPESARELIRAEIARLHVHLYYLYLRAGDDPALADAADGATDLDRPAGLDAFFRGFGTVYQGFEARDPGAVQEAARRIDALETRRLVYFETLQRRDLDFRCYAAACVMLVLSLLGQLAERGFVTVATGLRR